MNFFFNRIRYNYYISFFISLFIKPIHLSISFIKIQIEKKVWINGQAVIYDNFKINFPKNIGVHYSTNIFWKKTNGFETETYYCLKQLFIASDYFFDIGSNIGFYAVLAKKNNPNLKVCAFEPIIEIHDQNERFKNYNSVKYDLYNIALSNEEGYQNIYLPKTKSIETETTATLNKDSWQKRKSHEKIQVETNLLDNIISKMDIEKSAKIVIKIDVEDFEAIVFEGMASTVKKYKPIIICEVLVRNHGNVAFLKEVNNLEYNVFAITSNGYFRMTEIDFTKNRPFRDFILLPKNIFHNSNYFTTNNLAEIL